jgi:hypothetical protein
VRILKLICRTAVLSLIALSAHAQNRAIMEGIAASNNTVFVSTPTSNLLVGATYYPSNLNAVLVPGSIYTTGHIHSGSGFYTVGNATAAVYYGNMQYMSGLASNTTFMAEVAAASSSNTALATSVAASTTSIYSNLNSTASALTNETARAEAAESVLSASTVSVYSNLNSTASALTTETANRLALVTSVAASTTSIYSSLNSTASALTNETARALAAESVLSVSTVALAAKFVTNSSSMTNTSALGLLVASSVTASAFYGDASHLSNIPTGGAVTNTTTFQSSVTVQGNFGAATINSTTTFTAPITFSSNTFILGVTNGSNAAIANVGYTTCTYTAGPTNAPTSNQYGDIVFYTLPAGAWSIWADAEYDGSGATGTFGSVCVGGTSSGNNSAGCTVGYNFARRAYTALPAQDSLNLPPIIVSNNSAVTYYLKMEATYTVGTPTFTGTMCAQRIR